MSYLGTLLVVVALANKVNAETTEADGLLDLLKLAEDYLENYLNFTSTLIEIFNATQAENSTSFVNETQIVVEKLLSADQNFIDTVFDLDDISTMNATVCLLESGSNDLMMAIAAFQADSQLSSYALGMNANLKFIMQNLMAEAEYSLMDVMNKIGELESNSNTTTTTTTTTTTATTSTTTTTTTTTTSTTTTTTTTTTSTTTTATNNEEDCSICPKVGSDCSDYTFAYFESQACCEQSGCSVFKCRRIWGQDWWEYWGFDVSKRWICKRYCY